MDRLVYVSPFLFALLAPIIPIAMLIDSSNHLDKVSDFGEYYTAAWFLGQSQAEQIYDLSVFGAKQIELFPELGSRVIGFYLTPMVVPMFLPLLLLGKSIGYAVWSIFLIISVLVSVVLLGRLLALSPRYIFMLFAFVSIAGPVYESIKLGQIGPILLLSYLISIHYLLKGRSLAAGAFLTPLLAKPHLLLPVVFYFLGCKNWKLLSSLALFSVVLFIVSLWSFGIPGWQNYLDLISEQFLSKTHFTPTLRDQMILLFREQASLVSIFTTGFQIIVYGLLFKVGHLYKGNSKQVITSVLLCLPCALLFSPYVQIYDWILFLPAIATCFSMNYIDLVDRRVAYLVFFSLFVLLMPFFSFIHYYYVLKGGLINPSFWVGSGFVLFAFIVSYRALEKPGS